MADVKNLTLLNSIGGKSGVYFISYDHPSSPTEKFLVKVGLAVNKPRFDGKKSKRGLKSRLESYLLCYPTGFYIFALMFTNPKSASLLERQIHSYLAGKGRKADYPHSRVEEWYNLSLIDIQKIVLIHRHTHTLNYKLFNPPHFLTSNPTAGKQKILVPKSTPERRKIESKTSISPPHTTKKKKYRKSKSVKKKLTY
jgi:hypothetical protein